MATPRVRPPVCATTLSETGPVVPPGGGTVAGAGVTLAVAEQAGICGAGGGEVCANERKRGRIARTVMKHPATVMSHFNTRRRKGTDPRVR